MNIYLKYSIVMCEIMAKIFIYPTTSLILSDMVTRLGHTPLGSALSVRDKVQQGDIEGIDSPPLNLTPDDAKRGLKWAAVEVPAGIRGRMSLIGPLLAEAEAAIIMNEPLSFGCMGCSRTNELTVFLLKDAGIPYLELNYPQTEEEGFAFVIAIKKFLAGLEEKQNEGKSEV
jgi:putative methanogenesis marker protein 5